MSSKQQKQKDSDQKSQKSDTSSRKGSQADAQSEGGQTPRSQAGSRASSQAGSHAASHRTSGSSQPRSPRKSRVNKIYRCPPTPPPEDLMDKERGFVLDNMACSSISTDYSKANPKLGPVIPPYNSQGDKHVVHYYSFLGVDKTLKKTGQNFMKVDEETGDVIETLPPGDSVDGPVMDRFHTQGKGWYYLSRRNQFGAGHSNEVVDGHAQFMQGIKPVMGYNGKYGYRRNNPWLRQMPSPFGTASTSPTH